MGSDGAISVRLLRAASDIDQALWDACAAPETEDGGRAENPFLTHRWFRAFEESGSAVAREGWDAKHLLAETADGSPLGILPLYAKAHSQGEYVFDHSWANAFYNAGGEYYPKLLSAIPFTPVTARKLLVHKDADADLACSALIAGAAQITSENDLSSLHLNFCMPDERKFLDDAGFLTRVNQQFHWENNEYADFDAFLAALASRKRKAIKKERAKAIESVEIIEFTGDAIEPEHWDAFWAFYQDTGARKWGTPYLTRAFFDIAQNELRDDILLVLARREGRWVAGALNVIGRETLFGRYWGCIEDHPCLHFELCYYCAIDYAIRHAMARVEAGAQGEHKLARGYVPVETFSAHYIPDPRFREAIARYLRQEGAMVAMEMDVLGEHTPFKKGDG